MSTDDDKYVYTLNAIVAEAASRKGHVNAGLFTSNSAEWETPQGLFDKLNAEFRFTLDVCASDDNHKCDWYFTIETDGLAQLWYNPFIDYNMWWCNPPYGREIIKWVRKATQSAIAGHPGVMLLPARTDTKWWGYIWNYHTHRPRPWVSQVRFLKGRLHFGGAKNSAPFPSVVVVFGRR